HHPSDVVVLGREPADPVHCPRPPRARYREALRGASRPARRRSGGVRHVDWWNNARPAGVATAMTTSAPPAGRIGLGVVLMLSALTAIGPLTIDLYLAAFPEIVTDLQAIQASVQLTMTATLAGLALGQLIIGALSDAYGRRRPLLVALGVY